MMRRLLTALRFRAAVGRPCACRRPGSGASANQGGRAKMPSPCGTAIGPDSRPGVRDLDAGGLEASG